MYEEERFVVAHGFSSWGRGPVTLGLWQQGEHVAEVACSLYSGQKAKKETGKGQVPISPSWACP